MKQDVIKNPILNSPFVEPNRHFRFKEDGITSTVIKSRRPSAYFVPIAKPKANSKQATFDFDPESNALADNPFINQVREKIRIWREGGYAGVTRATQRLLDYWGDTERERKLFFCQREAVETAIYITEVAGKFNDHWIENTLGEENKAFNMGLFRLAFKMATGSGKTVVMAMLMAWQILNKLSNRQDARFTDAFLIVTPGITIRDRLRVLLPNDPENYYRQRDILPPWQIPHLESAKIIITNYHAFHRKEQVQAARLTKKILAGDDPDRFRETPQQMVNRVCRELGNKRNIIVINDEAHHCYLRKEKDDSNGPKLSREDKKEAEERNQQAQLWISGLKAIEDKLGIKAVYDLSATPFFLSGSGYQEGTLFPWVVSDFSLIDAIESGIVKVPRVPVADDSMVGTMPKYRNLWPEIRDELPKVGRKDAQLTEEPRLPAVLQGCFKAFTHRFQEFPAIPLGTILVILPPLSWRMQDPNSPLPGCSSKVDFGIITLRKNGLSVDSSQLPPWLEFATIQG